MIIGSLFHHKFSYKLKNAGPSPLKYLVDTKEFDKVNESNYKFSVFQLENPSGTINGYSDTELVFKFHPIEFKQYEIKTMISYSGSLNNFGNSGSVDEELVIKASGVTGVSIVDNR